MGAKLLNVLARLPGDLLVNKTGINRNFVSGAPSAQQTVDQFVWGSRIPIDGVTSGKADLFDDPRIHWLIERIGGVSGKNVLELGPLEGAHSAMLAEAGAHVRAIEANTLAYLKCLVVKDLLKLDQVDFELGDFNAAMDRDNRRYDLTVACGVLYHMAEPVDAILRMTRSSDRVFVWTHYFDGAAMPVGDKRRRPFIGDNVSFEYAGQQITGYPHSYGFRPWRRSFFGGPKKGAVWLSKADIFRIFEGEGFSIDLAQDVPDHQNGPCMHFLASR